MRPRTATIQVSLRDPNEWKVEIGDPKSSIPTVIKFGKQLNSVLVEAILLWKKEEGLSD